MDQPGDRAVSRNPKIETLAFDEHAPERVAAALGLELKRADFQLPGSLVWQATLDAANGRPRSMITFWPGIHRIDVVCGASTIVFTRIASVDIVPGVEVQFRRKTRECLILARNGQVIVRA